MLSLYQCKRPGGFELLAVKYCNDLNAGNSLTSVPDGYFKQLPNLTSIDLSFNEGISSPNIITDFMH